MRAVLTGMAAALAVAGGASAATITAGGPVPGTAIALDPSTFADSGPCGYGGSVVGDGCSVVLKTNPDAPDAYGRFSPNGRTWLDSQDLSSVSWTLSRETAFTSLTIALTDAYDQPCEDDLGCSFFTLAADGAEWSAGDAIRADGTLDWLTIAYDEPVTTATLEFDTRLNDGWGIVTAIFDATEPPAAVPLPASVTLLGVALAGLGLMRRRRA